MFLRPLAALQALAEEMGRRLGGPGRRVRANAEAVREPHAVAEALTALIRDHPPYGRWAHVRVGADGTPQAADVWAEFTRGRVLVRVQLPDDVIEP